MQVRQQEDKWGWKYRSAAKLVPLSSFVQHKISFNHSKMMCFFRKPPCEIAKKGITIWLMLNLLVFHGNKVLLHPNLSYRWCCCFCKHCLWAGSRTLFVQSLSWETPFQQRKWDDVLSFHWRLFTSTEAVSSAGKQSLDPCHSMSVMLTSRRSCACFSSSLLIQRRG